MEEEQEVQLDGKLMKSNEKKEQRGEEEEVRLEGKEHEEQEGEEEEQALQRLCSIKECRGQVITCCQDAQSVWPVLGFPLHVFLLVLPFSLCLLCSSPPGHFLLVVSLLFYLSISVAIRQSFHCVFLLQLSLLSSFFFFSFLGDNDVFFNYF